MSKSFELMDAAMAGNRLFAGLAPEQRSDLKSHFTIEHFPAGTVIVKEGATADKLYLVLSGMLEVLKKGEEDGMDYQLASLTQGETIGEMAILESSARCATVRATSDVNMASVPRDVFLELQKKERTTFGRMAYNLARDLSARLRHTNEVTVVALQNELKSAHARAAMGRLIIYTILLVSLYNLLLNSITTLLKQSETSTYISVGITAALAFSLICMMRSSGFPMGFYGFRIGPWKKDLRLTLLVTLFLCALATFFKWLLIHTIPSLSHLSVFDLSTGDGAAGAQISMMEGVTIALLYGLFSPVQEIIVRGGLQSSFQEFLTSKHRVLWAILLSNAMFAAFHIHVSTSLALLAMCAGWGWGWLYYKQKSLFGVSVSHILVGWYALFVLGLAHSGG